MEPAGCFDLRLARKYQEWERWKEAEQEYIQAGRIGAPCVRKEALDAIERLKLLRAKDAESSELDLADKYLSEGAWKEAEQHYAAAWKDSTGDQRNKAWEGIVAARRGCTFRIIDEHQKARCNSFESNIADQYYSEGSWKEAEQHYAAAGKDGTEDERKRALDGIASAHGKDSFEFKLGDMYREEGSWKGAEQHYTAAAKDGTADQREKALGGIEAARRGSWLGSMLRGWTGSGEQYEDAREIFDRYLAYLARFLGLELSLNLGDGRGQAAAA
jgi:hypothetical protein